MEPVKDLSPRELMTLKDIALRGHATNRDLIRQFADDDILTIEDGRLSLTAKGRGLLVRGSPLLWNSAA